MTTTAISPRSLLGPTALLTKVQRTGSQAAEPQHWIMPMTSVHRRVIGIEEANGFQRGFQDTTSTTSTIQRTTSYPMGFEEASGVAEASKRASFAVATASPAARRFDKVSESHTLSRTKTNQDRQEHLSQASIRTGR